MEEGTESEAGSNYRKTITLDPEHINSYHNLLFLKREDILKED